MFVASTFLLREPRLRTKGGDECDALSRAKRYLIWQAGERKAMKRDYRRRVRQMLRGELHGYRAS
jgi:hypothetical protein